MLFQSPSLRGSGRFTSATQVVVHETRYVEYLHCGAVVASLRPQR